MKKKDHSLNFWQKFHNLNFFTKTKIKHLSMQVHGAFLSGLREAGRIADYFLQLPTSVPSNDVLNNHHHHHHQTNKKS